MSMSNLLRLAEMLKTKNEIDAGIALVIGRPASIGYVGEYIACGDGGIDVKGRRKIAAKAQ